MANLGIQRPDGGIETHHRMYLDIISGPTPSTCIWSQRIGNIVTTTISYNKPTAGTDTVVFKLPFPIVRPVINGRVIARNYSGANVPYNDIQETTLGDRLRLTSYAVNGAASVETITFQYNIN